MQMRSLMVLLATLPLSIPLPATAAESAQRMGLDVAIADPHHHVVPVHKLPWHVAVDDVPDARIVRTNLEGASQEENVAHSLDGKLRAFTTYTPGATPERIFFEIVPTKDRYEIQGLPLPHRPFSNLTWVADRYLVFDRWSQPHYGVHYVVDALRKELLLVAPFPDQFYMDQQRQQSEQPANTASQPAPKNGAAEH